MLAKISDLLDRSERRECRVCATWICAHCKWTRIRANRSAVQQCYKCGSTAGEFRPTRHGPKLWRSHNEAEQ
jgi:hypothetical protein